MTLSNRRRRSLASLTIAVGVVVAVQSGMAAVKVHIDADPTFDFRQAHTWAWTTEPGRYVMVARTPEDDPDAIQRLAEPIIKEAVNAEMPGRGLVAAAGSPDLTVAYYLLLTIGASAQTMGQFLPATTQWGIPPFAPSTQSLEMIEQGSLVLDLSAKGNVVWRGVGQAKIKMGLPQDKRAALIREAVREILKRYPPKK